MVVKVLKIVVSVAVSLAAIGKVRVTNVCPHS